MAEYAARRDPNRRPTHPGELLREVIPATGKSKAKIAALLGKLFGDGAGVWVRMQGACDTWHAERELAQEIKKMPTLKSAAA